MPSRCVCGTVAMSESCWPPQAPQCLRRKGCIMEAACNKHEHLGAFDDDVTAISFYFFICTIFCLFGFSRFGDHSSYILVLCSLWRHCVVQVCLWRNMHLQHIRSYILLTWGTSWFHVLFHHAFTAAEACLGPGQGTNERTLRNAMSIILVQWQPGKVFPPSADWDLSWSLGFLCWCHLATEIDYSDTMEITRRDVLPALTKIEETAVYTFSKMAHSSRFLRVTAGELLSEVFD